MCLQNAIRVAGPDTCRYRHDFDCGLRHAVPPFVAITPFTRNQWEAWAVATPWRSSISCGPVTESRASQALPSNFPDDVVCVRPSSDRFNIAGNLRAREFPEPCWGPTEVSATSFYLSVVTIEMDFSAASSTEGNQVSFNAGSILQTGDMLVAP